MPTPPTQTACPDCGSTDFIKGPRGGAAINIKCSKCGTKWWFSWPFTMVRLDNEDDAYAGGEHVTLAQLAEETQGRIAAFQERIKNRPRVEILNGARWSISSKYPGVVELKDTKGTMLAWIEKRIPHCDRGHYRAGVECVPTIDWADGFPRYYMQFETAVRELELFLVWRLGKRRADQGDALALQTLMDEFRGMATMMDIPRDKNYPVDAAQCDKCGGHGCTTCEHKGWLAKEHPSARKCLRTGCDALIPPAHVAVYCSNACAFQDA